MFRDIVFIQKDKEKAQELAKKLGFDKLISFDKNNLIKTVKEIHELKRKEKRDLTIVLGGNADINRAAVSSNKVDILLNPEPTRKDSLHQRNSGLNHVLCNLAHENNVAIAINFNKVLTGNYELLGKVMQNIRFCRKFKVKTALASFANNIYELRDSRDLISLGICLGMTPKEAKNSLGFH